MRRIRLGLLVFVFCLLKLVTFAAASESHEEPFVSGVQFRNNAKKTLEIELKNIEGRSYRMIIPPNARASLVVRSSHRIKLSLLIHTHAFDQQVNEISGCIIPVSKNGLGAPGMIKKALAGKWFLPASELGAVTIVPTSFFVGEIEVSFIGVVETSEG